MIEDYIKIAYKNIKKRKLRSFLTLIGITISIATIFTLISISLGLQGAVEEQFRTLGTDKFFIQARGQIGAPGIGGAVELTLEDINVVKKTSGVKVASYMIMSSAKIEANNQVRFVMVATIDKDNIDLIMESSGLKIDEGRMIEKTDKSGVVLGSQYKKNNYLFKEINLGNKVTINDKDYRVKGILETVGNPPDDRMVYFSEEEFRESFKIEKRVDIVLVQIEPGQRIDEVAENVERRLIKSRGLTKETSDITILTPEELLKSFGTILNIITSFLLGVGAISLLVGGIGIANTMYTSVLERTREIGVMKSIGAQNKDILQIFLIESGILGLIGGILGISLGIGISKTIEYIAIEQLGTNLLKAAIPPYLVIGCLTFSFLIGTISGFWPAYKATRINPLEALRYE